MSKNLTTELTIDGVTYVADVQKAIEQGLLKKKVTKRPVSAKDIPNGSIFKLIIKSGVRSGSYRMVMLDNTKYNDGQFVYLDSTPWTKPFEYNPNKEIGDFGWMRDTPREGYLVFLDSKKNWVSEIEE